MKLNVKAFAIALGLVWGGAVFVFGLWATFFTPAAGIVDYLGQFYIGYAVGFVGAIIGFVWGFADAAIGGLIFAWLYNLLVGKFAPAKS
ncbi:MAG: bacteriophage holin [Proteobacteria bacterium]|nr:bacteriophage holin [Pseudomonadota bacterium]